MSASEREGDTSDVEYDTPAVLPDDEGEALERVAWHARMARKAHAELAEMFDLYDTEMARLTERREHRARIIMERIGWHQAPIESYHRMRVANGGPKTLELPHGTSRMAVPKTPKVWVGTEGQAAVLEWARASHPEILRGPLITDVREVVTIDDDLKVIDKATGEIVPGLVAQVPEARWSFDPEPGGAW